MASYGLLSNPVASAEVSLSSISFACVGICACKFVCVCVCVCCHWLATCGLFVNGYHGCFYFVQAFCFCTCLLKGLRVRLLISVFVPICPSASVQESNEFPPICPSASVCDYHKCYCTCLPWCQRVRYPLYSHLFAHVLVRVLVAACAIINTYFCTCLPKC